MPWGMSVSIGGGVSTFTDPDMLDYADYGGLWEARFLIGTRNIVGFEAAYVGTAADVNAIGLDTNAVLMSHGVEGNVRLNLLQGMWQPYVLAGAAYRHYSLVNEDFNTSSVANGDDVMEIPAAIGASFRYERLTLDARATIRPTLDQDIAGKSAELHNWGLDLKAGFEF